MTSSGGVSPKSIQEMFATLGTQMMTQATTPNLLSYEPHEKQRAFHESTAKGRLFIGGNRSGKTVGGVVEDLQRATKRHATWKAPFGPVRGRVIGVDFIKGVDEILIPQFKRWIVPSDLINGSWEDSFQKQGRKLVLANGSEIEFMSYEQDLDKHAGTSRHFVHFDEEPPKSIFQENLLRLVDTNGDWWITMSPIEGMTWVYYDLVEKQPPNLDIFQVHQDENPHLSQEAKDSIFGFLDSEQKEIRQEGAFVPKGGRIFRDFKASYPYVIPPQVPPSNWKRYVSIDSGWKNPAAIMWHAVSPNADKVITFHEIYLRGTTIAQLASMIHTYNKDTNQRIELYTGDPAMKQTNAITATSVAMEYSLHKVYLALEGLPRDVTIGLDKMMEYLKLGKDGTPTWQITADCPNLIREMNLYAYKTYASSKLNDQQDPLEAPKKKDDHAIDSSRYFFTRVPQLPKTPKRLQGYAGEGYAATLIDMANNPPPDLHRPIRWEEKDDDGSETWW